MIFRRTAALLLLSVAALVSRRALAQDLAATTSIEKVDIRLRYHGESILIFGAMPEKSDVIVKVTSPPESDKLNKKGRVGIFWMGVKMVRVSNIPGLYKMYTTIPFDQIPEATRAAYGFNADFSEVRRKAIFDPDPGPDRALFLDGLIRIKDKGRLYRIHQEDIETVKGTVFRVSMFLPSRAPTGDYDVTVYALRGGRVVAEDHGQILVEKAGMERWLTNLAKEHGAVYGLLAVSIALAGGIGISFIFKGGGGH